MVTPASRRTTRSARSSRSGTASSSASRPPLNPKKATASQILSSRRNNKNQGGGIINKAVRKWGCTHRPPAPGITFRVRIWKPIDTLTAEEVEQWEQEKNKCNANESTKVVESQSGTDTNLERSSSQSSYREGTTNDSAEITSETREDSTDFSSPPAKRQRMTEFETQINTY